MKINDRSKGQTVIELLVTLSVVVGLTTILIVYGRAGQRVSNVTRAAEALVFNLRRVQDYALNVRRVGSEVPCAWGIHFDQGQNSYIIFQDLPAAGSSCSSANYRYDGGAEGVETVNMEQGVIISSTNGPTDITFKPPAADVDTRPVPNTFPAEITLGATGLSFTRTISVNRVGQIQVKMP